VGTVVGSNVGAILVTAEVVDVGLVVDSNVGAILGTDKT
jgi:hypothetical protein